MAVFLVCAGLLGLLAVALSLNVGRMRSRKKILLGDGGDGEMLAAIRAHANFVEFVPLCLVLIWLVSGFYGYRTVAGLSIVLLLARIVHAAGMLGYFRPGRGLGAIATVAVMLVASVWVGLAGLGVRLY